MGLQVTVGEDAVAIVEFSRGQSNFFDYALLREVADALDELARTGAARAVVLCSTGRHFCAGADFSNPDEISRWTAPGHHLYDQAIRLFEQPLPLVAALQGSATGGGLGLALAADFRVATPETRLWAPFARLGLTQGFGLSVTLPRLIGVQAAADMLLTARRVTGEEAFAMGLVDEVVDERDLRGAALTRARGIAANAPLALRDIRVLLRPGFVEQVGASMTRERAAQDRLMRTSDHEEGVAASLGRRSPSFEGR